MEESSSPGEFVQEKNEAMLFEVHLHSIFKEIAACVSLETFTELFSDIVKRTSLLEKLHSAFVQELYDKILAEVQPDEFVRESNLAEKFSKRAKMMKENSVGEGVQAWRPETGNVTQQMRSHDMSAMLRHKRELEEFVVSREARVNHLRAKASMLRQQTRRLDSDIEASRRSMREGVLAARGVQDNVRSALLENIQRQTDHQ